MTAQLVEAPGGTVICSETSQITLGDIFQLQDELVRRIVESLKVPLTSRDHRALGRDVPASPAAYELYLRANKLAMEAQHWTVARDLYMQCVELDPGYAPAWARLGRIHRVLAKFGLVPDTDDERNRAEAAFRRALELNPELSVTHQLYTSLEIEDGRAEVAMVRLLGRLRERPEDPELLAGLVIACRYCGLLEASVAAHEESVRLDPSIRTSVAHSLYLLGDYERTLAADNEEPPYLTFMSLLHLGRRAEAAELASASFSRPPNAGLMQIVRLIQAVQTRDRALALDAAKKSLALSNVFTDPEGFYYWGSRSRPWASTRSRWSCSADRSRAGFRATGRSSSSPGSTRSGPPPSSCASFGSRRRDAGRRRPPSSRPEAIGCCRSATRRHSRPERPAFSELSQARSESSSSLPPSAPRSQPTSGPARA